MNKKLRKMLAAVSAVAVCATSLVSMGVGAIATFPDKELGDKTVSFSARMVGGDVEFHLWQKATDYFDDEDVKIYISDTIVNDDGKEYTYELISTHEVYRNTPDGPLHDYCSVGLFDGGAFEFDNKEDLISFEEYLSDNNIAHKTYESDYVITLDCGFDDEYFDILQKIKDDTGIIPVFSCPATMVQVTETENALPAPTLAGDANEDGKVSLADAVLIMQSLANPDDFQLTPQGMANADSDGDGVTVMDALKIQEMLIAE